MKIFIVIAIVLGGVLFECKAQSIVANLSKKFEQYQSVWTKTKLHLLFNQDKFSPGDTIWFKAYFLNEDFSFIKGKQLIDFDLTDSNGKSALHFVFMIIDGQGQNQCTIPGSLPAGIYQVNAYSSWMKNFNSKFIFSKEIVIVKDNQILPANKSMMSVATEGKHLVRSVPNKISIKSQAAAAIQVVDSKNQEVGSATTDVNGLATVVFTPEINTSYFVKRISDAVKVSLPVVEDDGCVLLVTPSAGISEPVKIIASSPPSSLLRNQELVMIVSSKGKIYHTASFTQRNKDLVELQIPYEKLTEGVSKISILNQAGALLASRDFFSSTEHSIQPEVQIAKTSFQTREKVTVDISLTDSKGQPIEGEFALNVINKGLFKDAKQNSFSDELNLPLNTGNEFVVDRSTSDWMTSLDNYLILFTDELPWKEILKNESKPFYRFTNVIQKRGSVYFADTSLPVPELTQLTFYLQHNKSVYHTFVDKGKVWLTMPDVFGQDEVFYLAESKRKQIPNVKIVWEDDPVPTTALSTFKEIQARDTYAEFTKKKRLIEHSYGFYSALNQGEVVISRKSNADFEDEIMGADIFINVQDYILFPTMEELIKEVIPPLYHRKFGERNIVRVKLPEPMNSNITGDAVYVIDGIATNNTAFFLSLKPADLLTVKVVRDPVKLSRFGLMGKNGIVIVQTKNGDTREPIDPSKMIAGLSKPLHFVSSNYSNANDIHRPDFRSTIYWNPSIKTDSEGKATVEFFSSDDIGKFKIRIDGITTEGRPFSAEKEIEVTLNEIKN